ncbi:AAA family ATPase [Clostridium botulinum]|nr:AAA family ATPase [Clostridium botulinum]
MGKSLNELAYELKDANHVTRAREASVSDVKVQLIYAFNGTGKTRLSNEFKSLISPSMDNDTEEQLEGFNRKYLYYNAFTEDLFYWDNDLINDEKPKLKIHPNIFTKWVFEDYGQDQHVMDKFQHYTNGKLTPKFNDDFSEVSFSYERGNDENTENIKISKGEESSFIWSVFYSLFEEIIEILNVAEPNDRTTNQFDNLEYVFIDDPVTSLDDNHLIRQAIDLAQLVKSSDSELKFIITTHNPLFYNVLHNELRANKYKKYFLDKNDFDEYVLEPQRSDSPFSYHLFLIKDIEKAIQDNTLKRYHFNYLRNILEKTATFLGYSNWGELLPKQNDGRPNPYVTRIINLYSHSKYSADEVIELKQDDKNMMGYIMREIIKGKYNFK